MDLYFKKEIVYPFQGEKFKFDVANTLFSTLDILIQVESFGL
jgi:hypothetical protein